MDFKSKLVERLQQIAYSLRESPHALALLALGSAGMENDRIDQYSDLDFFVICEEGFKTDFIEDIDWLKRIHPVAYYFKNTRDGYKLLYKDGVFCEFAVFESRELAEIPFSEGKLIWQREDFDSSVCIPRKLPVIKFPDTDWVIGEALTNLYVGLCRYHRGERLSAFNFIQSHALHRVIELMTLREIPDNYKRDPFSLQRRFEFRYPKSSELLPQMLQGYDHILESAREILTFLDDNFNINEHMKSKILELCNCR
jgi:hypothetical protein